MGARNTDTSYGSVARFFHWSLAALFLFQFGSIVAFRFFGQDPPEVAWDILNWHKTSGVLILMLGLCRLLWRWSVPLPSWPSGFREWDKTLSHFAERGLYTALFVMTISGLVIELAGGHYVPFLGLFYLDNIAPYFHPGAVSSTQPVVAAREAASLPRVSRSTPAANSR